MKRIVIDTCVIVSAFRSKTGASNALLNAVADGMIKPLVSTALFLEYHEVLLREVQMKVHGLAAEDVQDALAEFAQMSEPVDIYYKWRPQLRDPMDEMVLEAAVAGGADALVTYNVRDFAEVSLRFGLIVVRPGEFLKGMLQ